MAGSITTLGVGSNLELQSILEQLRETEQAPIKAKENKKKELKRELDAYNSVNTKLFSMKSKALSLSLESDFLQTKTSVSDDNVLGAVADDGIAESSNHIEVIKKAKYSSFQSAGIGDKNALVYAAPATGISSPTQKAVTENRTMHIKYGALENQKSIDVEVKAGMSLTRVLDAINKAPGNQDSDGNPLVKATMEKNGNHFYLHLSSVDESDAASNQVVIAYEENEPHFDFMAEDTTIAIGLTKDEKPNFLRVPPGTTYAQLAQKINDAQIGVTARMVDTGLEGKPFRLTITANETGEDNRIHIQNLAMEEVTGKQIEGSEEKESLNSEFKVNGITYQRQSNEGISDVISGVTLNLKKIGESSIHVSRDLEPIKENVQSLIDSFNELVKDIGKSNTPGAEDPKKDKKDNAEGENPLKDSFEAKAMLSKLRDIISTTIPNTGSDFSSLTAIGLEVHKDGTLSLNEEEFDKALESDPEKVTRLFIGNKDQNRKGLGDLINDGIMDMVSEHGLVGTEIDMIETRMENLTANIQRSTQMLDKRYAAMTEEFVRLDIFISQTNRESGLMKSMIDSFNKTMEK